MQSPCRTARALQNSFCRNVGDRISRESNLLMLIPIVRTAAPPVRMIRTSDPAVKFTRSAKAHGACATLGKFSRFFVPLFLLLGLRSHNAIALRFRHSRVLCLLREKLFLSFRRSPRVFGCSSKILLCSSACKSA